MSPPFLSVIIPVFRDTDELSALLRMLRAHNRQNRIEIVVVNGDAQDCGLQELRIQYRDVHWIDSPRGRGRQMNAGARASVASWLMFLHADVRLHPDWLSVIEEAELKSEVVGGAFRFSLPTKRLFARVIEWCVAARVRWFTLPYGDQAFFVRRAAFDRIGGFSPLPLMEDVDFIRRLAVAGRLWFPDMTVTVSPRRWEKDGWIRRTISNLALLALYFCGVSPARLSRWYEREQQ